MKKMISSFIPLALTFSFASSDVNTTTQFESNIRAGYISYDDNTSAALTSSAIGGSLGFTKKLSQYFSAKVTFYAVQLLDTNSSNPDFQLFAGDTTQSFGYIGQAVLKANLGNHKISVGRHLIDIPIASSDDIRMVPDLYEAAIYNYNDVFEITHISSMSGWENGGRQSQFIKVHDVLGITDDTNSSVNSGITVLHTGYENEDETFEIFLYNSYIHEAVNAAYIESTLQTQLSKNYTFNTSVQVDNHTGIETFNFSGVALDSFSSTVVGLQAEFELTPLNLSLVFAANKVYGTNAPLYSLGGGVYYTSLEYSSVEGVQTKDALAYVTSLTYDANEMIEGLNISYALGQFQSKDLTIKHQEHNLYIAYDKESYKFSTAIAYATGTSQFTQFRIFLDMPLSN